MSELPFAIEADRVRGTPVAFRYEADATTRAALAARFGWLSCDSLRFEGTAERDSGDGIDVGLRLRARIVQACVISADPLASAIDERLRFSFRDDLEEPGEVLVDAEAVDPAEPIVDGLLALGEVIAQHLAVSVDPYPRAVERAPEDMRGWLENDPAADEPQSHRPFDVLAKWKQSV